MSPHKITGCGISKIIGSLAANRVLRRAVIEKKY